ncbi:MAG: DUF998 domain-containing protein [Dehalococcoidia bacterium]
MTERNAKRQSPEGGAPESSFRFRALASCGIWGPALFLVSIAVASMEVPRYDPLTQTMSEVAANGPESVALLSAGGFVGAGVFAIGFALALHLGLGGGKRPHPASLLVLIGGMGMIGSGVFPAVPGHYGAIPVDIVHHGFVIVVFFGAAFAPLAVFRWTRERRAWQGFGAFSLVLSVLIGLSIILIFVECLRPVQGAVQRTYVTLTALWMASAAIRLLLPSQGTRAAVAQGSAE